MVAVLVVPTLTLIITITIIAVSFQRKQTVKMSLNAKFAY